MPTCPPAEPTFDQLTYCQYYEDVVVGAGQPRTAPQHWTDQVPDRPHYVHRRQRGQTIWRMNILYPSSGDVFYLKLLLLHTSPRSFEEARTIDGTVYTTFREAAQALGLLHDDAEGQLCFNEARDSGYSPVQLRALLVTLILDGDEHGGDILESNRDILMADLDKEVSLPSDVVWNRCLRDLANRLEIMGRTMTDFGLPEPADDTTELARERLRWDRRRCPLAPTDA